MIHHRRVQPGLRVHGAGVRSPGSGVSARRRGRRAAAGAARLALGQPRTHRFRRALPALAALAALVAASACDGVPAECAGTDATRSAACGRALEARCAAFDDEEDCNDEEGLRLQEGTYLCRWATVATFGGSTCEVVRIGGQCVVGLNAGTEQTCRSPCGDGYDDDRFYAIEGTTSLLALPCSPGGYYTYGPIGEWSVDWGLGPYGSCVAEDEPGNETCACRTALCAAAESQEEE